MEQLGLVGCVTVLAGALLRHYKKAEKQYIACEKEAVVAMKVTISSRQRLIMGCSWGILGAIGGYLILGCLINILDGFILLGGVTAYLITYYLLEYTPYAQWCAHAKGILIKRQSLAINWENIVAYTLISRKNEEILQLKYKGKGIVTRRCELRFLPEQEKRLIKLFEERLPYLVANVER